MSTYKRLPVKLFADIPEELRVEVHPLDRKYNGDPIEQCRARARGDTATIATGGHTYRIVPWDGGFQCQAHQKAGGMCWRHWNKAELPVRIRSSLAYENARAVAELMEGTGDQEPIGFRNAGTK